MEIRHLEDEIKRLCALAAIASDEEVEVIVRELRAVLKEHNDYVRRMVTETLRHIA